MKRWLYLMLAAALLALLGACGAAGEDAAPSPPAYASASPAPVSSEPLKVSLTDLIPILNAPEQISVYAGFTSVKFPDGNVYAPASDTQAEAILDLLSSVDASQLGPHDGVSDLSGALLDIGIDSGGEHCRLQLMVNPEHIFVGTQYGDDLEAAWLQGPSEAAPFPLSELEAVTTAVLSDTADTAHTGIVLPLDGSDVSSTLPKGGSAMVQNILEGSAHTSAECGAPDSYEFDLSFIMDGVVYLLDSRDGFFSREADGVISVYQLEPNWLQACLTWLGTASAAPSPA